MHILFKSNDIHETAYFAVVSVALTEARLFCAVHRMQQCFCLVCDPVHIYTTMFVWRVYVICLNLWCSPPLT